MNRTDQPGAVDSAARLDYCDCEPWLEAILINLDTWRCSECSRPTTNHTRARLMALADEAPAGHIWVLSSHYTRLDYGIQTTWQVQTISSNRQRVFDIVDREHLDDLFRYQWWQSTDTPTYFAREPGETELKYKLERLKMETSEAYGVYGVYGDD